MKKIELIILLVIGLSYLGCKSDEIVDVDPDEPDMLVYIPSDLKNSVLAFYPFTNGSLNDFSGNDQNLVNTTSASPTSDRSLNDNCAFEFDFLSGATEFLTTSKTESLNDLTDFSISLWYQPLENRSGLLYELLIKRGRSSDTFDSEWSIGLYDCRRSVYTWTNAVWEDGPDDQPNCDISNNDWHNLVATFEFSTSSLKFYKNGVLQGTRIGDVNSNVEHIGDLFIGSNYRGKIDDILIFNKTLSQSDVKALQTMETCCN